MLTEAATEAKAAVEKSFQKDKNYLFGGVVLPSRDEENWIRLNQLP